MQILQIITEIEAKTGVTAGRARAAHQTVGIRDSANNIPTLGPRMLSLQLLEALKQW